MSRPRPLPEVFVTAHCGKAHFVKTGKPCDHQCDVLRPSALRAERREKQHRGTVTTLPTGWTEATPGGMATNRDPVVGGIVDDEIVSGKWFAIANRGDIPTLTGFSSRAEAFAALKRALETRDNQTGDR